jgi:transcription antitermination factor NusG
MSAVPWFVLQVLTNHEKRVSQQLAVRSIENYLPTYQERSKWSDRTVTIERPLFPGYLFARFEAGSRLDAIGVNGVLRLVGGRDSDRVDAQEIERIQAAITAGYSLRPGCRMVSGMQVRLRTGVFEGINGVVTELNKNCSVTILLRNANHAFTVRTSIDDLDILTAACPELHSPRFSSGEARVLR